MLQIAATGLISVGVVLVLLLGEIDLSVGAVSGLRAAVMAVLNVKHGWNPFLASPPAIAAGARSACSRARSSPASGCPRSSSRWPGLLGWQGALLWVLGTPARQHHRPAIVDLANTFYSDAAGWIIAAVVVARLRRASLGRRRRRLAAGLDAATPAVVVVRVGGRRGRRRSASSPCSTRTVACRWRS